MIVLRLIGIAVGLVVALMGLVAMIAGVAVTILFFPLGLLAGFPITLIGGWVGGAGLALAGVSGGHDPEEG